MSARVHSSSGMLEDLVLPDRYRVVRRIARGGMGTVWCADDATLGRRVAIKVLGEQFVDDDGAVRRFKREARTAARLSGHPNIVTIYDVGETVTEEDRPTGRPFIVMEHLVGGSVANAIAAGPPPREQAVQWIVQAACALDHAHDRGVVHRDIKPGNLLLDGAGALHVADFGIATIATEETLTVAGQLLGTAGYLSPEQALGQPATEASDRYAFAVVAFELLTGTRPFAGEHFAAQARQHAEQEPPAASMRDPALPPAVDQVLQRGMAKQPEQRWATAGEFAGALQSALRAPAGTTAGLAAPAGATAGLRAPAGANPGSRAPAGATAAGSWTPRTTNRRRPVGAARPPRRGLALAALAAVALALGAAIGAASGGGDSGGKGNGAGRPQLHAAARVHSAAGKPSSDPQQRRQSATTSKSSASAQRSTSTPPTTTPTTAATQATPPTADGLEARGHQLMVDGRFSQAIPVLRQALAAGSPGTLTYAYAQFDLGRSLRLAGDPRDAAVVLQQRLQFPNQTDVVRHELELALRALGAQAGGPALGHHGHDHGHAGGPGGGPGSGGSGRGD